MKFFSFWRDFCCHLVCEIDSIPFCSPGFEFCIFGQLVDFLHFSESPNLWPVCTFLYMYCPNYQLFYYYFGKCLSVSESMNTK